MSTSPSPAGPLTADFGLTEVSADSLSPWSPVHRAVSPGGRAVVVKKIAERADAMAAVLLHNESASAPGRLQDAGEWDAFARAYLAHVDLTERERELWPHAVDHMLWEEGTWALEDNDADAWADPRQGGYLRGLTVATPEDFPLPR
ncbi:hypothetical protein FM125_03860 [Micrococcus lylae]|uniref:Uncharacterized protein n=1 Tax=Micrococcus lylae TaxID=1273 RepID=A0A1R4IQS8_9MICC|nr:hypothetical protein [Micrococcus lylae]SJN21935.1 hypothetical protein FM125_03860 [Micrococcus lylae]